MITLIASRFLVSKIQRPNIVLKILRTLILKSRKQPVKHVSWTWLYFRPLPDVSKSVSIMYRVNKIGVWSRYNTHIHVNKKRIYEWSARSRNVAIFNIRKVVMLQEDMLSRVNVKTWFSVRFCQFWLAFLWCTIYHANSKGNEVDQSPSCWTVHFHNIKLYVNICLINV